MTSHSPFCWVWHLSFMVLDFLLSSVYLTGRVIFSRNSLLLCPPECRSPNCSICSGSAWCLHQCGWCRTTDSAQAESDLQKVTAFISWPTTHFQPQPWADMVIPAPEKSGWFWSPHTWFMWLWAHPKWAVKAWPSWCTAVLAPYGKWLGLLPSHITVGSLLSLQEPLPSWSTEISFSCVEEWLL